MPKIKPEKPASPVDFESALKELGILVEQMDKGNLTLENSLAHFEKGVSLIRHCQELLNKAQQKIELYQKETGVLGSFTAPDADRDREAG